MPYVCKYGYCKDKLIPSKQAVGCSKCEKPFHKECFESHNQEKHSGKAIAKPLEDVKFPKSRKL